MNWRESKTTPEIVKECRDGDCLILDIEMKADLFQFQGHFPEKPIFPGVGQLDWAVQLARRYFGLALPVVEISQLKYRKFIEPGFVIQLKLDYQKEKQRVVFGYSQGEDFYSSGIIKLGAL